jgi:hypothetical protein
MTLDEHAIKIWLKRKGLHIGPGGVAVPKETVDSLHKEAYNELRDERDGIKQQLLNTKPSCCCDTGKAFKKIADELNVANTDCAEIAELAVEKIKQANQPEPPKKAVYEWVEGGDKFIMLFRDSHLIGHVHICGHYYGNARNGMGDIIKSPSLSLAKAAVEAVVRAHYGDEA